MQDQTIEVDGVDARGSQLGCRTIEGDSIRPCGYRRRHQLISTQRRIRGSQRLERRGSTMSSPAINNVRRLGVTRDALAASTWSILATFAMATSQRHYDQWCRIDFASLADRFSDAVDAINALAARPGLPQLITRRTNIVDRYNGAPIEVTAGELTGVFAQHCTTAAVPSTRNRTVHRRWSARLTTAGTRICIGMRGCQWHQANDILNDVNVLTGEDANDALQTLDFALQQVSGLRAELGAVQTRFESTISNLGVVSENLSGSPVAHPGCRLRGRDGQPDQGADPAAGRYVGAVAGQRGAAERTGAAQLMPGLVR